MINLNANTSGISAFTGGVEGILSAIKSPNFQGDFSSYCLKHLRKKFMADTIASYAAGNARIKHMFEWGDDPVPLFALTIEGTKSRKTMGFKTLPSLEPVPLPDPAPNPARRHVFTMKAVVMETNSTVRIAPRLSKKLFIPSENSPKGFIMTSKPVNINPGGAQSTGGFAEWWSLWFAGPAQDALVEATNKAEDLIQRTGQRVVRYAAGTVVDGKKVGGQFATGTAEHLRVASASERMAEQHLKQAAKFEFAEEEWDEE